MRESQSWCLGIWALRLSGWEAPDYLIFLGRFHPMVLHLPIGLLVLAVIIDLGRLTPWSGRFPRTTALMGLVTFTAFCAAVHGILLFVGEDYGDSELARRHLIGGSLFTTLSAAAFVFKIWATDGPNARKVGAASLALTLSVMAFASHEGASITHGSEYLGQYAPGPLKALLGGKTTQQEEKESDLPLEHAVAVQPILDLTCIKCHRPEKSAGRLKLDSYAAFAKGGKNGPGFVANSVEHSLFLKRMYLPLEDEDHMPPADHPQPTPEQGTLASFSPSDSMMNIVRSTNEAKAMQKEIVEIPRIDLASLVGEVSRFNGHLTGKLTFVLAGQPILHFDCFDGPGLVNDEVLDQLLPFAPYLHNIDLNGADVTTAGVIRLLEHTTALERLSLNGCAIDDTIVNAALTCSALRSLSLVETDVTDKGLARLVRHASIQHIYVGNSAVTPQGRQHALEQIPLPQIILGPDS